MNKNEIKNPVAAEATNNPDTTQTSDASPFVDYMRAAVEKSAKEFPNRFLFLIASDTMQVGETSDCFAVLPKDSKFTAGVLSALMVTHPEPLLESIITALHGYVSDQMGREYSDEFDTFMADLFKRAVDETKARNEAETATDEK